MTTFIEYIETSCANLKDSHMSYLYKKHILDKMTDRANEITHAGLKDEKVIADLMQDEFPNLEENFPIWEKAEKKRRLAKTMRWIMGIGGVVIFFTALILFFVVGKNTTFTYWGNNDAGVYTQITVSGYRNAWLIILGAIFALIIFYTSFGIKRICKMRRVFHPIARALIVFCVMLIMVFAFLCALMLSTRPLETQMWPIVIAGIILALVADIFFAFSTKQKFRTITTMIYMPIISTMLFVILNAYDLIPSSLGWLVIISGVIIDVIYALSIVASNAKYFLYKQEDDE